MFDWIASVISKGGLLGIAFLMFLENVFPPIPSELIMPLSGFVAVEGELSFWGVVLAGTVGSVLGQSLLYYVGRKYGEDRLIEWSSRHGHWTATSPEELRRAIEWFRRYETGAVFFCRLVPTLRSIISVPAGLVHMNFLVFLGYTTVGTAIWTTTLTYFGKILGDNYEKVQNFLDPVSYAVVIGIVGLYLWRVYKSYRS